VAYAITRKLTLGFDYRITHRVSTVASREYTQNVLGLRATYRWE
jgi:hypothetical protein